ncbi:hypothetical protein E1269_20805 [Jiangella asiatica]|uniref:Uncharacterized protein n=1 Tax=Jiangella asiatica TaxID=2530372 RepID=A0A4R5CUJ6_9ACTN|nr:hypothetical protein E1269_20805 [Jiangella asiatica]
MTSGHGVDSSPEKITTDPLGATLIAERAALLAGRDDEFVAVTVQYWTGRATATGMSFRPKRQRALAPQSVRRLAVRTAASRWLPKKRASEERRSVPLAAAIPTSREPCDKCSWPASRAVARRTHGAARHAPDLACPDPLRALTSAP